MVYKNAKEWTCPYCNLIVKSRRCLFQHQKECEAKQKLTKDSLGRVKTNNGKKSAETFKNKVEAGLATYKGHKHTDESKMKISEGRLKALREGRGNHWICPHLHRSKAEEYFYECFTNAGIKFESNVWLEKRYCVDFLFEGKLYFEVDGEQHYSEKGITHDAERTEFLKEKGYTLIKRCRWSEFMKMKDDERKQYINGLVAQLAEANGSNPF